MLVSGLKSSAPGATSDGLSIHTRANKARLLARSLLISRSLLFGQDRNKSVRAETGIAFERAMGAFVPDLMREHLRCVNIGEDRGLTIPDPSQKHEIAADVFLSTDSGRDEESATEQRKSATVDTSIAESELPRSTQNSSRR